MKSYYVIDADKHLARVKKLACGRSTVIPGYGKVTAYRDNQGKRRYSLSDSYWFPNGGNLGIKQIADDLNITKERICAV